MVREDGLAAASADRADRRTSLAYFGQLSDFQLADEESPARVEFIDPLSTPLNLALRSRLASLGGARAVDRRRDDPPDRPLRRRPPGRRRRRLAQPRWTSRSTPATPPTASSSTRPSGCGPCSRAARSTPTAASTRADTRTRSARPLGVPGAAEAASYTGVQDYDDYIEGTFPDFYDPNGPQGAARRLARIPGPDGPGAAVLHRRPASTFPCYVAFGNHDALVQGNPAANAAFEADRDRLPEADRPGARIPKTRRRCSPRCSTRPDLLRTLLTEPQNLILVPPDPEAPLRLQEAVQGGLRGRHPGRRPRLRRHRPGRRKPPRKAPPATTRSCPTPGMRMIALDTVCEGGTIVTPPALTADGNIDDPQFKWLRRQAQRGDRGRPAGDPLQPPRDPGSLTANVARRGWRPPARLHDAHGHDVNPGCDVDPRTSTADPPRGPTTVETRCTSSRT